MNCKILCFKAVKGGFVLAAMLLATLTGCAGYVEGPRAGVQVEPYAFAAQDDYVYYPNYECYYSVAGTNTLTAKATSGWRGQRRWGFRLTCCRLHRP